jgi:hypothetical protein
MLVSFCLEIVLILTQDSCTVCAKHTIGLEIILDAPRWYCGGIDPYTLMALHGPRQTWWPNLLERATWISELLGEPWGGSRDYLLVKET